MENTKPGAHMSVCRTATESQLAVIWRIYHVRGSPAYHARKRKELSKKDGSEIYLEKGDDSAMRNFVIEGA
jgi:hypothetical protein